MCVAQVEDACYGCREVVQDVSVVGVADPLYGESVCACVILRPGVSAGEDTAERLREHCRGQISHFKVPRYVRFVGEFPLTVSGKVQKYKLVDESNAELRLTAERGEE